ncbi:S-Ena type endospore appendage [Peribacillus simplex]|uniref:S-Ena type endospore appendage n=1 Tax=Peribacillus simplex TaxID=1478 RepID=UPI0011DCA231|nr:S-Ena type endospore appendage [Peribacillus simplex]
MCGSNGFNSACCPPAQMFQEKICGNFNGTGADQTVWAAPPGDYFEGTFQIFNSASSTGTVTGTINPGAIAVGPVPPGSTFSVAATNPTSFTIAADVGESGTYCITLYKRVLA